MQHEDNKEKQKTLQVDSIFGKGANKTWTYTRNRPAYVFNRLS